MISSTTLAASALLAAGLAATAGQAKAQVSDEPDRRIRIALGPEIGPSYPGARDTAISPFFDFSIAGKSEPFAYEAPDESFGFPVISRGGIHVGPTLDRRGTGIFDFETGIFNRTQPTTGSIQRDANGCIPWRRPNLCRSAKEILAQTLEAG